MKQQLHFYSAIENNMQQNQIDKQIETENRRAYMKLTPKRIRKKSSMSMKYNYSASYWNRDDVKKLMKSEISKKTLVPSYELRTWTSIDKSSHQIMKSKRIRKNNWNYYGINGYSMTSIMNSTQENNPQVQITIPFEMKKLIRPFSKKYTLYNNYSALNFNKRNFKINYTKQQQNQEELRVHMRKVAAQQQKNLSQFLGETMLQNNINKEIQNKKYQSIIKIPQELLPDFEKNNHHNVPFISDSCEHHDDMHNNFHNFQNFEASASQCHYYSSQEQQDSQQIKELQQPILRKPSLKHRDSSKLLSDNYDNQLQCYMSCVMHHQDSPMHHNFH